MKLRYIRAFIVLLAGLITLIMNMRTHRNVNQSLLIVLGVIILFYLISTLLLEIFERVSEDGKNNSLIVLNEDPKQDSSEEDASFVPFDEE